MTVRDTLIAARALIDTPEKWYQGSYEGPGGRMCASEAIRRVALGDGVPGVMNTDAYKAFRAIIDDVTVSAFNDTHTHAEVMAAFDRAIAASDDQDDAKEAQ